MISKQQILEDKRYLDLLAKEFPNIQAASTEIINPVSYTHLDVYKRQVL